MKNLTLGVSNRRTLNTLLRATPVLGATLCLSACMSSAGSKAISESESTMSAQPSVEMTTIEGASSATDTVTVTIVADVKKINHKDRMITLKGPQGDEVVFRVSDEVKRFKEIKAGDKVVVDYLQSLAFEVRPPTEEEKREPKTIMHAAGKAPSDLPPGAGIARAMHAIVTVVGIDLKAGTTTVRGPEGKVVTVQARHPERLKKIKVGDTIAVTYTEAVAISLEPYSGSKKAS